MQTYVSIGGHPSYPGPMSGKIGGNMPSYGFISTAQHHCLHGLATAILTAS